MQTGHVYAFDRKNGIVKWKYDLEIGVAGSIVTAGSKIYAMSFQQSLIGLDLATGKLIIPVEETSEKENFIFPVSPVISNNRIIYAKRPGLVRAISAENHKEIWSSQLSEQITSDLATNSNSIFVSTEGKKIYQISQETGKIIRTFSRNGTVRWKILSIGKTLVFLEWDDKGIPTLRSLDVVSGKDLWSQPSPEGSEWDTFRPLIWENLVIVGSNRGHVSAFDSDSGSPVWSTQVQGAVRMLGASDHLIYAGCSNGFLYALMPQS